jgi:hypothetical protein
MIALLQYFRSIKRDSGETVWCLTEDRPEWLQDAVRDAHGTDLPNDWIYGACRDACSAIEDGSLSDDDSVHEWADSQVDVYTRDLFQWSADMCQTDAWSEAESEASDIGSADTDMEKRIMVLQCLAYAAIARRMLSAVEDNSDDDTDESEG